MERESFEDPRTAALMNESFVCVKVDREERPDVDALYMEAVQGMTGHGGWPLNVFLTPEQLPFYGGTYFPPEPRHGHARLDAGAAGDRRGLERERARRSARAASSLRERLSGGARLSPRPSRSTRARSSSARREPARRCFDARNGGFGGAPEVPAGLDDRVPAAAADERDMALATLRAMAARRHPRPDRRRVSPLRVDATWTVPHFEKMLYDNALLARAYLHGFKASGETRACAEVCRETLDWALREMRGPEGGFYSRAGRRLRGRGGPLLRVDARRAAGCARRGRRCGDRLVRRHGAGQLRWDPHHPRAGAERARPTAVPRPERPARLARAHPRAAASRRAQRRARPVLDDKRLTSWNALMIARPGRRRRRAGGAASTSTPRVACADFVLRELRDGDGRLLRTYNDGQAQIDAYLEDHAFLLEALIALFEATCEERWFDEAHALADR